MINIVEEIIAKKPHLKETLQFYEKSRLFMDSVRELHSVSGPDLNAYPREATGRIIECFLSIFSLPDGSLTPLQQAMELGEIDFRRIPLLEVPTFSLPYPEDDCMMLLFLISRPFFFGMRESYAADKRRREKGRCSVCGARPTLSSLSGNNHRQFHCPFCGNAEHDDFNNCTVCRTKYTARSAMLAFQSEKGFTFQACDICKSYRKIVDGRLLASLTPDLADLISLPLDIAIQNNGYKRLSPNPLGMVRMSASG